MITINRFRRAADGQWDAIDPIHLTAIPAAAYDAASKRTAGPCAPTDDEIANACRGIYGRVSQPGFANAGDIDIDVHVSR